MKQLRKKIAFAALTMTFFFVVPSTAQTTAEKAAEAYRSGDFAKSIELYESIVVQGLSENRESADVYYNLGNAYFRADQVAQAILNYERALLLKPGDGDIRHNLRFARTQIEDKMDVSSDLFISNLWRNVVNLFDANTWAVIGIALFILFLGCVGVFLFIRILWLKKTAFYAGIVIFVLMLSANAFAFNQRNVRTHRKTAIIMAASASAMTSPDANSKELFRLHSGTKVRVTKSDGNWYEVEIANGSVGWIPKENVEII
ncbi:MAG: tetratricopeptide repeat protein [Dysgonamonadaceae bacterium]|jgi:tetratricopeptide (TPR) repeat protein|nr:tetratricopeptide repeat protein [Dysgonamonadaceae bacterium]